MVTRSTNDVNVVRMNLTARSMGKLVLSSLDRAQLLTESERDVVCYTLTSGRFNGLTVKMTQNSVEFIFTDFEEPKLSGSVTGKKSRIIAALQNICNFVDDPSTSKLIGESYNCHKEVILTTEF